MRKNIFQNEFRMQLRSVITWSVAVAVLLLVYISMFSSFAADAALLNEMMAKFPPALLTAFGLTGTASLIFIQSSGNIDQFLCQAAIPRRRHAPNDSDDTALLAKKESSRLCVCNLAVFRVAFRTRTTGKMISPHRR